MPKKMIPYQFHARIIQLSVVLSLFVTSRFTWSHLYDGLDPFNTAVPIRAQTTYPVDFDGVRPESGTAALRGTILKSVHHRRTRITWGCSENTHLGGVSRSEFCPSHGGHSRQRGENGGCGKTNSSRSLPRSRRLAVTLCPGAEKGGCSL